MADMATNLNLPQPDAELIESGKVLHAAFKKLEAAIVASGIGEEDVVQAIVMQRAVFHHVGVLQQMLIDAGVLKPAQVNLNLAAAFAKAAQELGTPKLLVPGSAKQ